MQRRLLIYCTILVVFIAQQKYKNNKKLIKLRKNTSLKDGGIYLRCTLSVTYNKLYSVVWGIMYIQKFIVSLL